MHCIRLVRQSSWVLRYWVPLYQPVGFMRSNMFVVTSLTSFIPGESGMQDYTFMPWIDTPLTTKEYTLYAHPPKHT